jgi:pSer/pThr/pTyr-binding forkhead associated (FHA) protein
MKPPMITLDTVLKILVALDKEQFRQQYPGFYLVAMGLLSAEEIVAGNSITRMAQDEDPEQTLPMRFGDHPRHDLGQPHPLAGRAFRLGSSGGEVFTLGRGVLCDICVPDESVSEQHCQLELLEHGAGVLDLGSTNGTKINLQRLGPEQQPLADGDMLTVGRYSFQLLDAATFYSSLKLVHALEDD